MRISDWSSDVCSSDLRAGGHLKAALLINASARKNFHRVGFAPLRREARLSGPAHVKPMLHVLCFQRNQRRRTVNHAADRKSVVSGKSVPARVGLGGRRRSAKTKQ